MGRMKGEGKIENKEGCQAEGEFQFFNPNTVISFVMGNTSIQHSYVQSYDKQTDIHTRIDVC